MPSFAMSRIAWRNPRRTALALAAIGLSVALVLSANAEWRGEIDRAAVRVHRPAVDVTFGRRAFGWGRGVLFAWTFGDRSSMLVSAYLPFGRGPAGAALGSAFGATPLGVFVQLKVYH